MQAATPPAPRAWIADDGELFELRTLLREEGIAFGEGPEGPGGGVDLLVSSPRRALELERQLAANGPRTHLVVAEGLTRTLRQRLQHSSFDFVVEPTIHRSALRLLVQHALYAGPERRSAGRVLVDSDVKLVVGWQKRRARLLQLSEGGCGLLLPSRLGGQAASLRLPPEWCDGARVDVPMRLLHESREDDGQHVLAFAFEHPTPAARRVLRKVLRRRIGGLGRLDTRAAPEASAEAPASARSSGKEARRATRSPAPPSTPPAPTAAGSGSGGDDRREFDRARYARRLLATRDGQAQVVIGRDLSEGGMRIDPDPTLSPGDELKLALYGASGQEPVVVRARVVRAGDASGVGLAFQSMPDEMKNRLAKLVDSLQVYARSSGPSEAAGRDGVVVSEVLGGPETAED